MVPHPRTRPVLHVCVAPEIHAAIYTFARKHRMPVSRAAEIALRHGLENIAGQHQKALCKAAAT